MLWSVLIMGMIIIALLLLLIKRTYQIKQPDVEKLGIKLDEGLRHTQDAIARIQPQVSEHLMKSFDSLRGQITDTLTNNAKVIDKQIDHLSQQTAQRLREINQQVENRLAAGFEKTTSTFQDVLKRLALIDVAQQKITELSSNVVSLQEILIDKRSRGAFGEVQLSALVRNVLPENSFALQHTFSTGSRADCVLFLPEPTGTIAIDAKFPLESYQRLTRHDISETERLSATQQFKKDIKKHIQDVELKYIIPGETTDAAMLFIPAEAIFADIHSRYPELVAESQRRKIWLASPTTLMAILTTARAVIKDDATRQQIHIIQEHLAILAKDFTRFQTRMTNLSRHIDQAHRDVKEVHTSADKISARFNKIEQVEIEVGIDSPTNAKQ